MSIWLAWFVVISVIISVAGMFAERVMRAASVPVRWIWLVALVATAAVPVAIARQSVPTAIDSTVDSAIASARAADATLAFSSRTTSSSATPDPVVHGMNRSSSSLPSRGVLFTLIVLIYAALPVALLVEQLRMHRLRKTWREAEVDGHHLLLSDNFGPAVVGVMRTRIVLPTWSQALPAEERALLLTHEAEHVRAHDGRLTLLGLLIVALMPWNPVAWWQLSRLRLAIEVDCDARVLRRRPDRARYGNLLIDMAGRVASRPLTVAAFAKRRSSLRERLLHMTPAARDRSVARAFAAMIGTVLCVGCIGVVPRPEEPLPLVSRSKVPNILPLGLADSLFGISAPYQPVGRGTDLPAKFVVEELTKDAAAGDGPRCAQSLRDPRDSTRLVQVRQHSRVDRSFRADTVVTLHSASAYYLSAGPRRYGTGRETALRVGCDDGVVVTVAGRRLGTSDPNSALHARMTTLATPGDDRARILAYRIARDMSYTADSLELRARRVHVVFSDSSLAAMDEERRFNRSFDIARFLWREYGSAAGVDTVTVRTNSKSADGFSSGYTIASFYPEQLRRQR